ncbi:MAG: hypothetical protein ACTHLT_08570, partial [Devosia sp.]
SPTMFFMNTDEPAPMKVTLGLGIEVSSTNLSHRSIRVREAVEDVAGLPAAAQGRTHPSDPCRCGVSAAGTPAHASP